MKALTRKAIIMFASMAFAMPIFGNIMSGEERAEKIKIARALIDNKVIPVEEELLAFAPSPFVPDLGKNRESKAVTSQTVALSDEELLEGISKSISPTGIFLFGGEYYLIFKEKKVKTGSEIGIMYRNTEYSVIIADITDNTYSIQFGDAQMKLKLK